MGRAGTRGRGQRGKHYCAYSVGRTTRKQTRKLETFFGVCARRAVPRGLNGRSMALSRRLRAAAASASPQDDVSSSAGGGAPDARRHEGEKQLKHRKQPSMQRENHEIRTTNHFTSKYYWEPLQKPETCRGTFHVPVRHTSR